MSNNKPEFEGRKSDHSFELIRAPASMDPSTFIDWSQPGSERNDSAGGGLDLSRFMHALRRRWLMALIVALPLSAIATCAFWYLVPRLYTSTAILRLAATEIALIFETADTNKGGPNAFEVYKRTQRQLLRSRFVMTRALRNEALAKFPVLQDEPDPVQWLETNLNVTFPDDSEIMHVSLSAGNAERLHQLVNGAVKAYFDEIVFAERNRRLERLNNLELAYKKAESELRSKRTDLKQLVDRVGTGDLTALTLQQQNVLRQYTAIQQLLSKQHLELTQALGELELHEGVLPVKDRDEDEVSGVVFSDHELLLALQSDKAAESLKAEKQKVLDLIAATRGRVKEGVADSKLEEQKVRLERCDKKIEARKQEIREELIEHKRLSAAAGSEALNRKVTQLKSQENHLLSKARDLEAEAQKFGRSSIDVEMMRTEITALQDVSSRLGAEIHRSGVELQSDSKNSWTRVTLLNEAQPARHMDGKSRLTKTIAIGFVGLLFPAFFVVWLDARKNRINSGAEVERGLGLSVIGAVPIIPQRVMRHLNGASAKEKYWRTLLSESVDSIAAVLLRGAKAEGIRVVMVSSATAGEGKTTLAANLATSLAGAGWRTILVDFDLRRPALHRVFDLPLQPGINDVLRDPQAFDSAIQSTQIPSLAFLAAGPWNGAGLGGLGFANLKLLFDHLRDDFEFVVVDGSPILPVVDTRLIAQHVDTVVLSVLRDVSRVPQVRAACELLQRFAIPIFGVVVTGSKGDSYPNSTYEPYVDAKAV